MSRSDRSTPLDRQWRFALVALTLSIPIAGSAIAQTTPAAQVLPYVQDFRTLASTSTAYPTGWQGWINGAPGAAYLTTGPTADAALIASSGASNTTGGIHNYTGKIGPLNNGTNDYGLSLAVNTTGFSGVVVSYEAMTIRNPYDGTSNTRINELSLQYRVGTAGAWTTLAGTAYQNNTTLQTGSLVVRPQKLEYRSVTLPAGCDNQAVVQLRWAQLEVSGGGSRPGFAIDNVAVQQPPAGGAATALQFNGSSQYVTFGQAPALGVSTFTIETWFRRTGTGVSVSTGTGGIATLMPLMSKGIAEGEGSNLDLNFILGINTATNVIAADYEEAVGQTTVGLNHPVSGVTPIALNTWYHAAATFDGTTLRIYLNGTLENTLVMVGSRLPESASIQHAALATALNSTGGVGATLGYFQGQLDEARIWNVARSTSDIFNSMNYELTSGTGLIARWGMNDGAGAVLANSLPTPGGILVGGPTWVTGSPSICTSLVAPADPTGLAANAPAGTQIQLTWADNATSETAYEVTRSSTGPSGTFTLLTTRAANATSYTDTTVSPLTQYCYQVRAISVCAGNSAYTSAACATTPGSALDFGSAASTYVTFGDPAALDLAQFTVECWFRRDGAGTAISTGGSGVTAVPLVSHGAPEADGSTVDMNFMIGIRSSDGVLCADFEEGPGGTGPVGLNHPVAGVTTVGNGWHHGAATYDGTTWRLYLDSNLEATLTVGQPVRSNSIQPAALATMLTSANAPRGFFDGVLDEVRVWSSVRTQAEIQSAANTQITVPTPGLVARWGLDEGSSNAVNGSAGTTVNGSITGTDSRWVAEAPFNLTFVPPAAPSGLAATATTHSQVSLTWTDNATNETSYEVVRSTTGIGGPYTLLATLGAGSTSYSNGGLTPSTPYCYQVRAVNGNGPSAYDGPQCATTPALSNTALSFSGSTATPSYASFGSPAALQLNAFTIEMWMRRDGAGEGTNTGTGGIADAIPLVAKGRADLESATADINYLFGIRAATGTLCADFEEGQSGASPSLNHPIEGATAIALGTWHHVAATYDGTTWKLYLDGNLDASLPVGRPLAAASTTAVSLASALTSANAPAGFFNGTVDEVRIWNVARDQSQIQSTANAQLSVGTPGLVARWGLDEGSGTAIGASAGTTANGTVTGPNYAWASPGAPFNLTFNQQPASPVLVAPADNAINISTSPSLDVAVSDPEGGSLTVTWYGRPLAPPPGPDFTLIGLPDTQYYVSQLNGGTPAMFTSQTNWIVANRASRNIVYVGQLGDCVENGDNGGNPIEWQRADASLSVLENPVTTGLPEGIPFGVSVGNHDQSPIGDAAGSTVFYNQYFGSARFAGRTYYGGHYGSNNDNWYELFSASGMDFIVISFEYDTVPDAAVLSWADNLLATNPTRRGIILSHFFMNSGTGGGFGPQGQATYDALKARPNLDFMLCGHVPGEGRRSDTFGGNTTHTMLSDYQGRTNGGNGLLRILEFSPANNEVRVKTYSPFTSAFEIDGDSQFTLPYDMLPTSAFAVIGSTTVPSGSTASITWPGLAPGAGYEWYATVSDGAATTAGPVWDFATASASYSLDVTVDPSGSGSVAKSPSAPSYASGTPVQLTATANAGYAFGSWSGDATGSINPVTVTMDASKSVTANFVPLAQATVAAISPSGVVTTVNPAVNVEVRISRTSPIPILGFSVTFALSPELVLSGSPAIGPFLTNVNPNASFQVVDHGGGQYTADGISLGLPCGATALDEVLFTIPVGSGAASDTGTVTIVAAHLRKCDNDSILTAAGTAAAVNIERLLPMVAVTSPNGGEFWVGGTAHDITWTAVDASGIPANGVDLAYSIDGSTWVPIATAVANSSPYSWTTPAIVSNTVRVQVTARDTYGNAGVDASNADFTLAGGTVTALAVTPDPGIYQDPMALTATVTPTAASGTVEFFEGSTSLGTAPLTDGSAQLATSSLPVGTHVLHATYLGSTLYASSTSGTVTREVKAKIVASAGANGSIAPVGTVLVSLNAMPAFTLTPDAGYHVSAVTVDGLPVALTSPYSFPPVSSNHTIHADFAVNPLVAPIASLTAAQVTSGNDADGTLKLRIHWDEVVPAGSTVEVYRARFDHYPRYDDDGGVTPVVPSYPPASPWTLTGVSVSDGTDEVNNVTGYDGRDTWYYVAFVKDEYNTVSAVSNLTIGRPNYLLGDVSDGTVPGLGRGNNVVNGADISALGESYGMIGAGVAAVAYLDLGPTEDFSVTTRPTTDNRIDFEDLVMLAINFDVGAIPQVVGPARARGGAAPTGAQSQEDQLTLESPDRVTAGQEFTVALHLDGGGRAQALSAGLSWPQGVVEPIGVEAGEWLAQVGGVAFSPRLGAVDVVLLGVRGGGFEGTGVVATVRFRALQSGEPHVAIADVKARDASNHSIGISTSVITRETPPPSRTELAPVFPNPFQGTASIAFGLAESGPVTVAIYSMDGRLVRTLASGTREAGHYRLTWDGRNHGGQTVAVGIYFVQLTTPHGRSTRSVAFLK